MLKTNDRRLIYTADAQIVIVEAEGKPTTLTGYALVWNVLSTDRGGYKVRLLPNSATFTNPAHAVWHHEFRDVIGSTENGTLRIMPDNYGVKVEIDLPNTTVGRDVATLVRDKYVKGMSFSMVDDPKSKKTKENGDTIVNAESYTVDEVTVTAIPAFSEAIVGLKMEPGYAARTAQAIQLNRFTLNQFRLPGAELPRAAV